MIWDPNAYRYKWSYERKKVLPFLAGYVRGFEPLKLWFVATCSNPLSYWSHFVSTGFVSKGTLKKGTFPLSRHLPFPVKKMSKCLSLLYLIWLLMLKAWLFIGFGSGIHSMELFVGYSRDNS